MSVAAANLASSSSSSVVLNVSISTFSLNNGTDLPYGTFVGTIISNSGGQIIRNGKECHKHGRLSTRL
jgi:hypothetical protein